MRLYPYKGACTHGNSPLHCWLEIAVRDCSGHVLNAWCFPFPSLTFEGTESNNFIFTQPGWHSIPNGRNLRDNHRTPPLGRELSTCKDHRYIPEHFPRQTGVSGAFCWTRVQENRGWRREHAALPVSRQSAPTNLKLRTPSLLYDPCNFPILCSRWFPSLPVTQCVGPCIMWILTLKDPTAISSFQQSYFPSSFKLFHHNY